jgi:peptidoglycan/xylan/chitin deacetylase (PgdA/CDA1 family)
MKRLIKFTLLFVVFLSACKKSDMMVLNQTRIVNVTDTVLVSNDSIYDNKFRVVILMYHKLVSGTAENIYERSAQDFQNDLNFISNSGYEVLSFDDLLSIKAGTRKLTSNAVIISFDDGHLSDYSIAYQELKKMEMPATFFLVSDWVGDSDRVSISNVVEMDSYRTAKGNKLFSMHSHSKTHPFLLKDSVNFNCHSSYQDFLTTELGDSKSWIQNLTGQSTMWLALPYGNGANNALVIETAKNNGYAGIRTSLYGSFTIKTMDPFALPGLPILSTTWISDIDNYMP